jgi:phage portal protein, HK97 family
MATEGYVQNPHVYACVTVKQKAIGGIPLQVYKVASDGSSAVIINPTHPLVSLLDRPNQYESWPKFIEHVIGDLEHSGNCYIERVGPSKNPNTRPRELNILPPAKMRLKRGDARQPIMGYQWGGDVDFEPWQVLHLKYYNPLDYFYGLSPLAAASHAVDMNNAADTWNYSLFRNAGRPSGILTLAEEVIDETSFDDIVGKLRNQYTGQANAGTVMVLTGDMKWTPTSLSPADMDFKNMYVMNLRSIAAVFGVPPTLIGEETSRTYGNYAEARQSFYKETILPMMDWLCAELTHWLSPLYGGNLIIDYDRGTIESVNEDTNNRYDRILRAVTTGILTPNEGRQVLGYSAIEGGDERTMPLNLAPESVWREASQAKQEAQGDGGRSQNPPGLPDEDQGQANRNAKPPGAFQPGRPPTGAENRNESTRKGPTEKRGQL